MTRNLIVSLFAGVFICFLHYLLAESHSSLVDHSSQSIASNDTRGPSEADGNAALSLRLASSLSPRVEFDVPKSVADQIQTYLWSENADQVEACYGALANCRSFESIGEALIKILRRSLIQTKEAPRRGRVLSLALSVESPVPVVASAWDFLSLAEGSAYYADALAVVSSWTRLSEGNARLISELATTRDHLSMCESLSRVVAEQLVGLMAFRGDWRKLQALVRQELCSAETVIGVIGQFEWDAQVAAARSLGDVLGRHSDRSALLRWSSRVTGPLYWRAVRSCEELTSCEKSELFRAELETLGSIDARDYLLACMSSVPGLTTEEYVGLVRRYSNSEWTYANLLGLSRVVEQTEKGDDVFLNRLRGARHAGLITASEAAQLTLRRTGAVAE